VKATIIGKHAMRLVTTVILSPQAPVYIWKDRPALKILGGEDSALFFDDIFHGLNL
jgi:hypothetical protein